MPFNQEKNARPYRPPTPTLDDIDIAPLDQKEPLPVATTVAIFGFAACCGYFMASRLLGWKSTSTTEIHIARAVITSLALLSLTTIVRFFVPVPRIKRVEVFLGFTIAFFTCVLGSFSCDVIGDSRWDSVRRSNVYFASALFTSVASISLLSALGESKVPGVIDDNGNAIDR